MENYLSADGDIRGAKLDVAKVNLSDEVSNVVCKKGEVGLELGNVQHFVGASARERDRDTEADTMMMGTMDMTRTLQRETFVRGRNKR
jgi:hypothetical protein